MVVNGSAGVCVCTCRCVCLCVCVHDKAQTVLVNPPCTGLYIWMNARSSGLIFPIM